MEFLKTNLRVGSDTGIQESKVSTSILTQWKKNIVSYHNQERAKKEIPSLTESPKIDEIAQKYADELAQKGVLKHSGIKDYGENLAVSSFDGPNTDQKLFNLWLNEEEFYVYGKLKSIFGKYGKPIGHYTQVMWKDSTEIGVGISIDQSNRVWLVCNYYTRGNLIGATPW